MQSENAEVRFPGLFSLCKALVLLVISMFLRKYTIVAAKMNINVDL